MFEEIKQRLIEREQTKRCNIVGEVEEIYYNTMVQVLNNDEKSKEWIAQVVANNGADREYLQNLVKKCFDIKLFRLDDEQCYKNLGVKWTALGVLLTGVGLGINMDPVAMAGLSILGLTCMRCTAYFVGLNKDGRRNRVYNEYEKMKSDSKAMTDLTTICLDRYIREEINKNEVINAR